MMIPIKLLYNLIIKKKKKKNKKKKKKKKKKKTFDRLKKTFFITLKL